jgi:hypothetical protein
MPKEFAGVFYTTGLRGVGKSTLMAQVERPDLTLFLDFDDGKGLGLHEQLKFRQYQDVMADMTNEYGRVWKPIQMYQHLDKIIDGITKDEFTHCILDNIDYIEQALVVEVKRDPDAYNIARNKSGISNAVTGAFGGAYPGVNQLVSGLINILHSKGIRVVSAIAHTKAVWGAGGIVPNKYKPRGVERWQQMSILSLVVIPGTPHPLPPAALVQKEALGKLSFDSTSGKFEKPIRRLPLRLPEANFEEIKKYLKKPADLRNPKPGEVPTIEEQSPFSDKFSREQLAYMTLAAQVELTRDKENGSGFAPVDDHKIAMAKQMLAAGKTVKETAKELGLKIDDLLEAGLV